MDTVANVIRAAGAREATTAEPVDTVARRRALRWIGVYVALSGLALVLAHDFAIAALHLLLLGVVAWAATSERRLGRVVGDVAPLIIAVALYGEIPRLIAVVGTSYHDATIQHLDLWVFGTEPAKAFASALPFAWLSEPLHAGYMLFYPMIFVPPLLLYVRGERRGFSETIFVLTATWIACWVCFIVFPVEGPRYLWGPSTAAPDGPMRRLAVAILAAGSSRGAAFPSSHMAVSVAQTLLALKWQRRVGVACVVVSVLVGLGAVYGGFHYGVDMIAGALVGGAVALAIQLFRAEKQLA